MKYTPRQLQKWDIQHGDARGWRPARPEGYGGLYELRKRIGLAWGVLTGRYDALYWED